MAAWGPNVRDVFPKPTNIDGVVVCAGHDLVDIVTSNDDRLTANEVEDLYQRLDTYVTNRTSREIDDHGPVPRPLTDHVFDLAFGVLVGLITIFVVGNAAQIEPAIVTYPASCVAIITGAGITLAKTDHHRIRASMIGAIGASTVMLLIAVVIIVVNLIQSLT